MSKFREIVLKAIIEAEETKDQNMLTEDLGSWARAALLGGALALGSINPTDAKTNYDALHTNHEITARREHGGQGYLAVAKDNYGGYSYGKEQLSTERRGNKPSTFDFFLKYTQEHAPQIYNTLIKAGGQPAAYRGDQNFISTWKKLAERKDFQQVYDGFILNTQIIPVYDRMDNTGDERLDRVTTWGSTDNAIQAAIKSMIIQHGPNGAYNMIKEIMRVHNPKDKAEFLQHLYSIRTIKFPKYKKRYAGEYKDLKKYLGSGTSKILLTKQDNQKKDNLATLIDKIQQQV